MATYNFLASILYQETYIKILEKFTWDMFTDTPELIHY